MSVPTWPAAEQGRIPEASVGNMGALRNAVQLCSSSVGNAGRGAAPRDTLCVIWEQSGVSVAAGRQGTTCPSCRRLAGPLQNRDYSPHSHYSQSLTQEGAPPTPSTRATSNSVHTGCTAHRRTERMYN
jgi:hypothetical protein